VKNGATRKHASASQWDVAEIVSLIDRAAGPLGRLIHIRWHGFAWP
jgi:hypothetical protein